MKKKKAECFISQSGRLFTAVRKLVIFVISIFNWLYMRVKGLETQQFRCRQIRALHDKGLKQSVIAEALACSQAWVSKVLSSKDALSLPNKRLGKKPALNTETYYGSQNYLTRVPSLLVSLLIIGQGSVWQILFISSLASNTTHLTFHEFCQKLAIQPKSQNELITGNILIV